MSRAFTLPKLRLIRGASQSYGRAACDGHVHCVASAVVLGVVSMETGRGMGEGWEKPWEREKKPV